MRRFLAAMAVMTFMSAAVGCATESTRPTLRLGAIFPLSGSAGSLGSEEFAGVKMAAQLVNADGGVDGKRIAFDVRNVTSVDDAARAVASLRHDGARIVIGGYASDLSMAASAATARQGLVYWEAGAVADRLTGRGLPGVFRVGATGSELGANAGQFVVSQIAPRLHRAPSAMITPTLSRRQQSGCCAPPVSVSAK